MNAFDKISNHVEQHQYRKGRFVGDEKSKLLYIAPVARAYWRAARYR